MASQQIAEEKEGSGRMRLIRFNIDTPRLWFKLAEMQFALNGIKDDESKYNYIATMVYLKCSHLVEDLIFKLENKTERYNYLKRKVLKRLTGSSQDDLQYGEKLEDILMPSHYYLFLKTMAHIRDDPDFIIEYWKSVLPQCVKELVDSVKTKSIKELLEMADMVTHMKCNKNKLSKMKSTLRRWRERKERRRRRRLNNIGRPIATSTPSTSADDVVIF